MYLAGRRDLGASLLADKDSAPPRLALLNSPLRLAVRLPRQAILSWLGRNHRSRRAVRLLREVGQSGVRLVGLLRKFGSNLTEPATRHAQQLGARTYAGVIFLISMTLIMVYVASAMGRLREDEAEGYLDNLFVRGVSRPRSLTGRIALVAAVVAAAGVLGGAVSGWRRQPARGADLSRAAAAGLNSAVPAALLLGVGVFASVSRPG